MLAKILEENGGGRGLISICTAGGMGVCAILERPRDEAVVEIAATVPEAQEMPGAPEAEAQGTPTAPEAEQTALH
jgi:acetyl-CoA C-acetyltransferase